MRDEERIALYIRCGGPDWKSEQANRNKQFGTAPVSGALPKWKTIALISALWPGLFETLSRLKRS